MIKHKKIQLNNKSVKKTKRYKKIRHIISALYKIKEIDRKKSYSSQELRMKIFNSSIGRQVRDKLTEEKVTQKWLNENGFTKVTDVFQYVLQDR